MSSEMSDDPESSNPIETLPDDPILHILSYLPGADLVKLSEVDKNFKRIVTESTETMSKIRLMLDFNKDLDLDYAIELAQARRFTGLRLKSVSLADANAKFMLISLLEILSDSVDDMSVEGPISQEFLSSILAMFLPKLKNCVLVEVEVTPTIEEISHQNIVGHPLESLELICSRASEVLQLFSGCNQLKTLNYNSRGFYDDVMTVEAEHLSNFLATQDRLEKLVYDATGLAWNRLTCFKLKELTVGSFPYGVNDELAAAKFLKKLPNLTKLDICIASHPSCRLIKEICRIPKLEKLTIKSSYEGEQDEDEDSLERFVNHTVKELQITEYHTEVTSKLLKIFLGVASVYLEVFTAVLDLSDIPLETIRKIKISDDECQQFEIKFSPSEVPTNIEQFESTVMELLEFEASTVIVGIKIGHESWRNSGAFRLSNSFCEDLVNRLPKLVKLEIYNIAERGRFIAFLDENQARLNLEDVELHKPFEAGEPKPKKMKIRAD